MPVFQQRDPRASAASAVVLFAGAAAVAVSPRLPTNPSIGLASAFAILISCALLFVNHPLSCPEHFEEGTAAAEDNLECRREGYKCFLVEKESDASRDADVKCPYALKLIGTPRGARTESGYAVTDSGRLRGSPQGSERKCNLLLTDPLVRNAKGVSNCNPLNSRLSKIEFNKRFISSISKNDDNYTCEVAFSEDTTPEDMRGYLKHLDDQAKALV